MMKPEQQHILNLPGGLQGTTFLTMSVYPRASRLPFCAEAWGSVRKHPGTIFLNCAHQDVQ
eukprot:1935187-Alexandrium_andersonii.AAC.1